MELQSPQSPQSAANYLKHHTRLLLLLALLGAVCLFIITNQLLVITVSTDSTVESGEPANAPEDAAPALTERQIFLATKRQELPRKSMGGSAVAVEGEAETTSEPGVVLEQTFAEWQAAQAAAETADGATETQASVDASESETSGGDVRPSNDQGSAASTAEGTVIESGTITLAGPVTVVDPLAIGTPKSLSITGSIFALDSARSVMSFTSEGGSDLTVEAPNAQVVIDDTSMTFAELLPSDIVVIEGTQFEGSPTITATKITVVGVMDFTVPLEAPDVSVTNES